MKINLPRATQMCGLMIGVAFVCSVGAPPTAATDSDLWASQSGPGPIAAGTTISTTVEYGNNGPDTATSALIESYFTAPMGLDVFIQDFLEGTQIYHQGIESSAEGSDTLGNLALLFWDQVYCEELKFVLQGDDGQPATWSPIAELGPGENGSFSYLVDIPMDAPRSAVVEITEPATLARAWTAASPRPFFYLDASAMHLYGRGGCDKLVGTPEEDVCEYIDDNCFGQRVSHLDEPIAAEWEVVDDGSAIPSLGCDHPLVGFTPGNVALIRRGDCEFGMKAFNAEQAGATAAVIVNNGQCVDDPPSDSCVMNMGSGSLGALVTIPVIMLPMADGEALISAIGAGDTIHGVIGGSSRFSADAFAHLSDGLDNDPVANNDGGHWVELLYGGGCSYAVSHPSASFGSTGGVGSFALTTACPWWLFTEAPWVSLTPPTAGTGDATIQYEVSPNPDLPRSATIMIGNATHYVLQSAGNGCTYSLNPGSGFFMGIGGEGSVELTTQATCEWTATSAVPWMNVAPSSASGTGSATITYSVAANASQPRDGAIFVADQLHQVSQQILMGCDFGIVTDDGSAENGYGGWSTATGYLQLVTPKTYPYAVTHVCAAFTRDGSDTELAYDVVVYDASGPGGSPGNLVAAIPATAQDVPEWPAITFESVELEGQIPGITDGPVFVGVMWDWATEGGFYLGVDESPSTPQQQGYFTLDGNVWQPLAPASPTYRSLLVRTDGLTAADGVWTQVVGSAFGGGYGFGNPSNARVVSLAASGQALFAGTINFDGAEVYYTTGGASWIPGSIGAFGPGSTIGVIGFAMFRDQLYATTVDMTSGGSVYRTDFPPNWAQVVEDGFGNSANISAASPVVFSDQLYVGTYNSTSGAEIWRSPNGSDWTQVASNGFGEPENIGILALVEFDGALWAGVNNWSTGAQVWRSEDGVVWTRAVDAGFGDPSNVAVDAIAGLEGHLYAGVTNYDGGAQIWRSADGSAWENMMNGGFGDPIVGSVVAFHVDGGQILASTTSPLGAVHISDDGASWRPLSSPGFNNPTTTGLTTFATWNGEIYVGTSNDKGGEIWRGINPVVFFGGFESGDTDRWSVTQP